MQTETQNLKKAADPYFMRFMDLYRKQNYPTTSPGQAVRIEPRANPNFIGKPVKDLVPDTVGDKVKNTGIIVAPPNNPNVVGQFDKKRNLITIAEGFRKNPYILTHEVGHSIWRNSEGISPEQKSAWQDLHMGQLKQTNRPMFSSVHRYKGSPSHSFADAFAFYANSPGAMQQSYPELYNYFRDLLGFEYSRGLK